VRGPQALAANFGEGIVMNPEIPDIGEVAPDFEVLKSSSETYHLQQALGTGRNVLLFFYRGHW